MLKKTFLSSLLFVLCYGTAHAQHKIKPGFDAEEYISLLSLGFFGNSISDTNERKIKTFIPKPILRQKWVSKTDGGCIGDKTRWADNFYAAMISATGTLQLNDSTKFNHKLSGDDKATVHVGWTVALASMAPDMVSNIKKLLPKVSKTSILLGIVRGVLSHFLPDRICIICNKAENYPKTFCSNPIVVLLLNPVICIMPTIFNLSQKEGGLIPS